MRTRRSPRNQEILWRALGGPKPQPAPPPHVPRCFDCAAYPKGGRSHVPAQLDYRPASASSRVPKPWEWPKPNKVTCYVCGCGIDTNLDGERAKVMRLGEDSYFVHRKCAPEAVAQAAETIRRLS